MKYDFWTLIHEFSIKIPVIQRDYAQGRKHPKVDSIRREFIANILLHLERDQDLELDFIYGAKKQDDLVILDGQQRLTTLFLLHFYIYSRSHAFDQDSLSTFKKFRYETRQSTDDFLESLILNDRICQPNTLINPKNDQMISARIKNEAWYFSVWNYDPSIQGMLRMLDEIELQINLKALDPDALWQKLSQQPRILFYFLEMKDFSLTDELYIKMNARGVHLSEFENFKAWLNQEMPVALADPFFAQLDKQWTDFFWSLRPQGHQNIDDILYECFKVFSSGILALSCAQDTKQALKPDDDDPRRKLIDDFRRFTDRDTHQKMYIDLSCYQQYQILSVENCSNFSHFMNFLCTLKNNHQDIFQWIAAHLFEPQRVLFQQSYQAYILTFSIFIYCKHQNYTNLEGIEKALADQHEQFKDYFNICHRIMMNIVHNTTHDYLDSIGSLQAWAEALDFSDVIKSVAELDETQLKLSAGFKRQYAEEKRKAQLIQKGWDKSILDQYAAQDIFHGQIGFLLDWSQDQNQHENEQQFQMDAKKLLHVFELSLNEADADLYLLQRALLCYADYLPQRSGKSTFCNMHRHGDARSHNENWRLVFKEKLPQNSSDSQPKQNSALKMFIDDVPDTLIRHDFIQWIERKKVTVQDWRRLCIDFPQTLRYTKNKLMDKTAQGVFLIHQEKRTRYVELRSYCLSLDLAQKLTSQYHVHYKDSLDPAVPLSVEIQTNGCQIFIRYDIEKDQFIPHEYRTVDEVLVLHHIDLTGYAELYQCVQQFSAQYLIKDGCSEKTDE